VARSRQQRRARRAEQAAEPRATARAAAAPREAQARRAPEAPRVDQPRGGFIRESYGELKKVEWPSRQQVITGTIVVIIAVTIVGFYLWVADQAFKNLVEKVLI
jgi:preprotein translocase subunit SecE